MKLFRYYELEIQEVLLVQASGNILHSDVGLRYDPDILRWARLSAPKVDSSGYCSRLSSTWRSYTSFRRIPREQLQV